MRVRPIIDGDIAPVTRADSMDEDLEAVGNIVESRLRFFYGEWWEDREIGFEIPEYLFDGVRMPAGEDYLAGYISSYVEDTEGVTEAGVTSIDMDGRKAVVNLSVSTEYGELEGSVDSNVLLQAISGQ